MSVFCNNSLISEKINELSICNATIETCSNRVTVNREQFVIIDIYIYISDIYIHIYMYIYIYRPHTDSIENLTIYLQSLLNIYSIQNTKLVLLANDMNIDLLDTECSNTQGYMSMLYSIHCLPAISNVPIPKVICPCYILYISCLLY